jgi:hypothetical protein
MVQLPHINFDIRYKMQVAKPTARTKALIIIYLLRPVVGPPANIARIGVSGSMLPGFSPPLMDPGAVVLDSRPKSPAFFFTPKPLSKSRTDGKASKVGTSWFITIVVVRMPAPATEETRVTSNGPVLLCFIAPSLSATVSRAGAKCKLWVGLTVLLSYLPWSSIWPNEMELGD